MPTGIPLKRTALTFSKIIILICLLILLSNSLLSLGLQVPLIMSLEKLAPSLYFILETLFVAVIADDLLGSNILKTGVKHLKTGIVNIVPIQLFLTAAKYLPIGSWFEYQHQDEFGNNPLIKVVRNNDMVQLEEILGCCSKRGLYKMLLEKNWLGSSPLDEATDLWHAKSIKLQMMRKIIDVIEPDRRYEILTQITDSRDQPFIHSLTFLSSLDNLDYVVYSLPQPKRWAFINQTNQAGNTPLHLIADFQTTGVRVSAFLKHVPKEYLLEFANRKNKRGHTALMLLAKQKFCSGIETFIKAIPASELQAFFDYENQGVQALIYANNQKHRGAFEILSEYGLTLTEEESRITLEDLQKSEEHSEQEEAFKEKQGQYPTEVLGLKSKIYTPAALRAAYKQKLLQCHPDKSKSPKDGDLTQQVIAAYKFLTDKDKRADYKLSPS